MTPSDSSKKSQENTRTVKCPRCGHLAVFSSENPFRPFCSERCRLIDLGQWADESYKIPTRESSSFTLNDDSDENEKD